MNIYLREFKAYRKSLLIWMASLMFLIVAGMSKFSAFKGTGNSMDELLGNMPVSLQRLFGYGFFDFSIAIHFYGALFMYIALLMVFHAIYLGSGIVAKEETDKTAEFLFTKPISRINVLTYKILSSISMVVIFSIVNFVFTLVVLAFFSKGQSYVTYLVQLSIALLFMQMIFLFIGFFLATFMRNQKKSSSLCASIVLSMFFLAIASDIMPGTDFLKWFTIFKYFDAKDILLNTFYFPYITISIVLLIISIIGTYYYYGKRDLNI